MIKEISLLAAIVLLVLTATATGIFYRTSGTDIEYVSIRGQSTVYQGSGLYQYNPVSFVREGIIWDFINLFIALPLFVIAAIGSIYDSLRARLLLGGMLAYFFYVYLSSVMMYTFNILFLVYVAIFSLSAVMFVNNMTKINILELPVRLKTRLPRRLFVGYAFIFAVSLVALWIVRIVPLMRTGLFPEGFIGLHTLGSQALDLGLIVPLALATGVLLHKQSPWGYYLCSLAMVIGLMMFISIPAWITVPLIQDGKADLFEAVPFFALSVAGIALAVTFYLNISGRTRRGDSIEESSSIDNR